MYAACGVVVLGVGMACSGSGCIDMRIISPPSLQYGLVVGVMRTLTGFGLCIPPVIEAAQEVVALLTLSAAFDTNLFALLPVSAAHLAASSPHSILSIILRVSFAIQLPTALVASPVALPTACSGGPRASPTPCVHRCTDSLTSVAHSLTPSAHSCAAFVIGERSGIGIVGGLHLAIVVFTLPVHFSNASTRGFGGSGADGGHLGVPGVRALPFGEVTAAPIT